MRAEENNFQPDNETKQRVQRYESMKKEKTLLYFDVHEFEDIIDYYLGRHSLGSAIEAVKIGLGQHPSSMAIKLREAQVLIDRGKLNQSLEILKRLSFIENTNYEVFFLLGTVYSMKGKHKQSIENYNKALSLEPEDKSDIASQIGMDLQGRNRFKDAIKYLKTAYKLNSSRPGLLMEIAFCYEKSGELEKSEQYFRTFLDKQPYSEAGWYGLAVVLSSMEKYFDALDAFDFVLAINEENELALFNKANILFLSRRYEDAVEIYKELLEIGDDNIEALLYMAESYEEMGEFGKAEDCLKEARKMDPDSAEAFYGMGLLLMKKGKIKDSRKHIRKAISLDKENAEFWYALSRSFQIEKRNESALNAIDKAVEIDPFSQEFWLEQVNILISMGREKEAIESLSRSFDFVAGNALFHYKLGILLLKSLSIEKGLYHVEQGLILDYDLHIEVFKTEKKIYSSKEVQSLVDRYYAENSSP